MSALVGLECAVCSRTHAADQLQTVCQACDSPLLARYDLAGLSASLTKRDMARRPAGLWRWAELLPVREAGFRVSLGEGDTPLIPAWRLGEALGVGALFIKDEGANPTGTFKARGMTVAVSRAAELGARVLAVASAGNAGGALAAYAARAGLEAHVFIPADAPAIHRAEARAAGADLRLVEGLLDEAGRQAAVEAQAQGWFDMATFKEPYRLEGKKTMGFELAEAFGWDLPDVIVYPTGGGTGLVGMWKAFDELQGMGWIGDKRPRLAVVQPSGCAPVVRALEAGDERARRWEGASTQAHGLRVPKPYADRLILRAVRQSRGVGVMVSEGEMRQAQADLARQEGILACLEGAATLAGLRRLVGQGWVRPQERVALFNTGTGLKCIS